MTDKKVVQLVKKQSDAPIDNPEFRKALDEMYQEILSGKSNFVLMLADKIEGEDGPNCSFITDLDQAGSNLLIDQIKISMLLHGAGVA